MSALGDLDAMVLRQEVYPPLTTKNAELTFEEWDQRVIDTYRVIQDVVNGDNVEAYDAGATYDGTSSDVYQKFVGYDSRIWQAVFAGTFSGQTPAEGVYWTQITLAQLLPNILKLAQLGASGQITYFVKKTVTSAQILAGAPIAFGITVPSGSFVNVTAVKAGIDFNTTVYDTNTAMGVRCVGATDFIARSVNVLASSVSRVVNMAFNSSPVVASDTQYVDGTDVEIFFPAVPLNGDSNADVYMTYTIESL